MTRFHWMFFCGIAGLILSALYTRFNSSEDYRAYARISVSSTVPLTAGDRASLIEQIKETLTDVAALNMIQKRKLYEAELKRVAIYDLFAVMKKNFEIRKVGEDTLEVAFTYHDGEQAQNANGDLVERLLFLQNDFQFKVRPGGKQQVRLEILGYASCPQSIPQRHPDEVPILAGGLAIGILAGWARSSGPA